MQHRCTYVDKKSVTSCFALFLSIVSSTIGIECSKWVCLKKKAQTKITFYTWDFAGQVSGLCMGEAGVKLGMWVVLIGFVDSVGMGGCACLQLFW